MLLFVKTYCPRCKDVSEHFVWIAGENDNGVYVQFICLDPYCDRITRTKLIDREYAIYLVKQHLKKGEGK